MHQLYAFESDSAGIRTKLRSSPFDRQRLFEIPPHHRQAFPVEEIYGAVAPGDRFAVSHAVHNLLMPAPQTVDLRQAVLEYQRRIFGRADETMHIVIDAAFAVFLKLRLYLEAAAFGEPACENAFDLDPEVEHLIRVGPHSEKIGDETETCIES